MFKNSDSVNLTLRISEIGAAFYQDPDTVEELGFIEIYNYGDDEIELSDLELRSSSSKMGATDLWEGYFSLPDQKVGAGEYILLRPESSHTISKGWKEDTIAGVLYISNGDYFPFWTNYGFAELVSQGQSVDFVRWGSSSIADPVEGQYESKAPAFPWGDSYPGNRSIGRYDEDRNTDSGMDWQAYTSNTMITPGGPNS
jgi:hypothetical protein